MSACTNSSQVDSSYVDLRKAFDRINGYLIITKREGHGIFGSLLKWSGRCRRIVSCFEIDVMIFSVKRV